MKTECRVQIHQPTWEDEVEFRLAVGASYGVLRPWIELDDTAETFHSYLSRYGKNDERAYLIREISTGLLVGFVNANNIVRGGFRSAYLGYGAFAAGVGRGLMREGASLVIDELFDNEKLHRLEANIQPSNTRSFRFVQRLGFRKEGYSPDYLFIGGAWRDHERWALTVDMWAGRLNQ